MSKYKYLVFDIDDTIFSFSSAFDSSQVNIAKLLDVTWSDEYKKLADKAGWRAWGEMNLDKSSDSDIQKNYHKYYYEFISRQYRYLLDELKIDRDISELIECYDASISSSTAFMEECTLDVIKELSTKYEIALATNGIEKVQTKRTEALRPYIKELFISESIGTIKPSEEYFRYILDRLNCDAKDCLMIGDSVSNDMVGAKNVGMATCYYNFKNIDLPSGMSCDYVIRSMAELKEIL